MHHTTSTAADALPPTAEGLATLILTSSLDTLAPLLPAILTRTDLATLPRTMHRQLRVHLGAARSREQLRARPCFDFPQAGEDDYWLNYCDSGSRIYEDLNRLLPGD